MYLFGKININWKIINLKQKQQQDAIKLKKELNPNVKLVPNVGDYDRFNPGKLSKLDIPADIAEIPKPIIGSVGAIDNYKVNLDLVYDVAKNNSQWSFVFIGPVKLADETTDISRLKELVNVYFLGLNNYKVVPSYVKAFDLCMIPYRENNYNKYSLS